MAHIFIASRVTEGSSDMTNKLVPVPEQSQRELFSFVDIENDIKKYWHEHAIESKLKERCSNGKKFYFLDGPPYTAGNNADPINYHVLGIN